MVQTVLQALQHLLQAQAVLQEHQVLQDQMAHQVLQPLQQVHQVCLKPQAQTVLMVQVALPALLQE